MSFNENLNAFMLGQRLRPGLMGVGKPPPIMIAGDGWYKSTIYKSRVTTIELTTDYTPTDEEDDFWYADKTEERVKCYLHGAVLTIVSDSKTICCDENASNMFYDFYRATEIRNIDMLDTRNVTNMSGMFYNTPALTSLDLSAFDTRNVTDMSSMFCSCGVTSLDLSAFDTRNVTDMSYMFRNYMSTSLDLSAFDTRNVTNMSNMFATCDELTSVNLTSFDTSNVTDMTDMFLYSRKLADIYVSDKWIINENCDISCMFAECGTKSVTYV